MIGRSGSGKTTVARALGGATGIRVLHLDRIAWRPGWRPVHPDDFAERHAAEVVRDRWILDGGYRASPGWAERLRRADLVVIVEAPLAVCLVRIVRRALQSGAGRRPDLPDGCDDTLDLRLVGWTLTWGLRHRGLAEEVRRVAPGARLVRVRRAEDLVRLAGQGPTP